VWLRVWGVVGWAERLISWSKWILGTGHEMLMEGREGEGGKDRRGDVYSFFRSFVLSFLALRSKVQHALLSLMMMLKLCIFVFLLYVKSG
jgi:hypothetical protein